MALRSVTGQIPFFLIFHFSQLTLFVQKKILVLIREGEGGGASLWKKVVLEQYMSTVLNIYVFL